jgi:prevent-host-death family protein
MMMTSSDALPAAVLKRTAVVYVRQSTPAQVQTNLESQRRQYELVEITRRRGFRDIEVIDDDLGRSASGMVARPGFERLVAWLCAGEVGAVLCFDASRLARNGRDWHHLLELCGLVEARVIDLNGVYDPCRPNDRLLLGMKGSISEFELGVLRARMLDAARAKARRGEQRIGVPIGYIWHREVGLGLDPDRRIQEAIHLIFSRFRELGSARQVLLSMTKDQVHFPRPSDGKKLVTFEWLPIRYRNVISVLKNPFYAGAYAYGKSEQRTALVDGRLRKTYGHGKPLEACEVLLKDHHTGYIDWAEFERNQRQLAANAYGRVGGTKSGRGGRALLPWLLTCGRCGRRLSVVYAGRGQPRPVYRCDRPNLMLGLPRCLTFGGPRIDTAIAEEVLRDHRHGSGMGRPGRPARRQARGLWTAEIAFLGQNSHKLMSKQSRMRRVSAKDAKYNFGQLIDLARAAPIAITKYDRAVVVVMAVEEYDRLTGRAAESSSPPKSASRGKRPHKKAGA